MVRFRSRNRQGKWRFNRLKEAEHFKTKAKIIEATLSELKHNQIDTILFDLNLHDVNGTRPAQLVRKKRTLEPLLVNWCNSGIEEKITALGAGAVGYLTKPINRYELMVSLGTVMRQTHDHVSVTISIGNLVIDLSHNCPAAAETRLELTAKEFWSLSFWLCKRVLFSAKMHFWTIFMAALINRSYRSSTCLHASCVANLLKMAPNALAWIWFGGEAIFFARRAIIRRLTK